MRKVLFLLLFLLVLGAANINSQVRIGGDGEPHTSAVLDLNVDNSDDGNNRGLALPRVELINSATQLNGTAPTKGMLVYNTNPAVTDGQGTGVYYWNGSVWMVVAGEVGAPGPNAVGAAASYKTWCFPAYTNLGCWTIDNSRELPSSATTYVGQPANAYGSYYTWAQAAGACSSITGYLLPDLDQWAALSNYLGGPYSSAIEKQQWFYGDALAGFANGSTLNWSHWAYIGYWWSAGAANQNFRASRKQFTGPAINAGDWFSVRCVKSSI